MVGSIRIPGRYGQSVSSRGKFHGPAFPETGHTADDRLAAADNAMYAAQAGGQERFPILEGELIA